MGFSLGGALKGAGGLIGFKGSKDAEKEAKKAAKRAGKEAERAARENKEISLYDASVMEKDAVASEYLHGVKLQNHWRSADMLLGRATARLGKSGVVTTSGSALDAQAEIVREAGREADIIVHDGQTARERRLSAASRYRMLAEKGLRDAAAHAQILDQAGAAEASQHRLAGYGQLLGAAGDYAGVAKDIGNSDWFKSGWSSIGSIFGFGGGEAA